MNRFWFAFAFFLFTMKVFFECSDDDLSNDRWWKIGWWVFFALYVWRARGAWNHRVEPRGTRGHVKWVSDGSEHQRDVFQKRRNGAAGLDGPPASSMKRDGE